MAAAVAPSADVLANAGDNLPDWMTCDLGAYRILQDVSTQIVANCESFGKHLESVCGDAIKQMPPSDDSTAFDCADACIGFLSAFGALSNVLLALAGDLECSVKTPLQDIILSLTEERTGRMKHWKQVRSRFAELQERYGRSRQRSEAARGKLEKCDNKGKWFALDKSHKAQRAADEQHAAMCDLAQCEEELNATEASLRRLEDESREWLRQLSREKQVVLRGVLAKGTGSLGRFVSVAEKAVEKAHDAHDQEVVTPTGWSGVLPSSTNGQEDSPVEKTEEKPSTPPVPQGVVPQPEAECQEEASEKLAATDPSSKYLQNPRAPVELDISELSDSEDDEAAYRATHWSPQKESPLVSTKSKRRSLVFMGSGSSLIAQSKVRCGPASSSSAERAPAAPAPEASAPRESPAVSKGLQIGRLAALRDESTASACSNADVSTRFRASLGEGLEITDISSIAADLDAPEFESPTMAVAVKPPPVTPSQEPAMKDESAPLKTRSEGPELAKSTLLKTTSAPSELVTSSSTSPLKSRSPSKDDDDENDEDELGVQASASASAPLETPDVDFEIVPLVVESGQKCFEKYVNRLHERIAAGAERSWEKILARANEQQLGGHVGKLECFWICRPGVNASPETADGFVCFQFVQGFASNFARILHLSVVGDGAPGNSTAASRSESWPSLLPSAIFQVRRLLFETLPVDSLRSVVLAGEDDSGGIYVDTDIEVSYVRCNFRWFQLTQTVRRTKKAITRKQKVRNSRFLVLSTMRRPEDPKAPRNSSIARRPALLLQNDSSAEPESSPASDGGAPAADLAFSSW